MSSWRWSRTPTHITSTCDACGAQITGRTDTDLLRAQRGHDLTTCIAQQRAARVAAMADTDESPTASTVYVYRQGKMMEKRKAAPAINRGLTAKTVKGS